MVISLFSWLQTDYYSEIHSRAQAQSDGNHAIALIKEKMPIVTSFFFSVVSPSLIVACTVFTSFFFS